MKKNQKENYNIDRIATGIYPRDIYITDCEPGDFCRIFKSKEGEAEAPDKNKAFASVYESLCPLGYGEFGVVMWVNNEMKLHPDEIAHEICHIVDDIYNYVGVGEVHIGGEQHAYFFQYIYRLVYDKLDKLGRIYGK